MLARYYCMNSQTTSSQETSDPSSLSDRLLKECAGMCIEAAQRVTSLIIETIEPDQSMGILPWWYRIYYLHIAGINFLAAMFSPDLFTEPVSQSWDSVMSALRAHEHLSMFVQQCIETFETLSARIMESQHPAPTSNNNVALGKGAGGFFNDIFQGENFDFDNFLFNAEDIL
jgi:hypothetical protein